MAAPPSAQHARVEFPANNEHEQQQPHLRHQGEIGPCLVGEDLVGEVTGQQSEQAGAHDDAGHDLADHRWLAQALGQPHEHDAH